MKDFKRYLNDKDDKRTKDKLREQKNQKQRVSYVLGASEGKN
jgi:hypothetical protein